MIKEATHRLFLLCAFLLAAAVAGAQTGANPIYVSWDGTETAAGDSWDTPTTLSAALQKATAGTEIWLKGSPSPYQPGQDNPVYVVPDQNGFTVPAGVALYGGFRGTETSPDEREVVDGGIAYRMKYRTVLTGDIQRDDQPHNVDLIFPNGQNNRSDNATHVLTLDLSVGSGSLNSGAATVVNGVTIARGHADDSGEVGGGIYVTAGSGQQVGYRIEQCFFIGNYATWGGALYVDDGVADNVNGSSCLVDRCGFFNNAAGSRSGLANQGGAIYLGGAGCVVNTAIFNNENGGILIDPDGGSGVRVLNSTVTRNTGSGIDGNGAEVVNTVIWGNAALYSTGTESPNFQYCAYPESDDTGSNIYLSDKNNDPQGPHFNSPSLRAGFDRDYDITATLYPLWTWVPLEGSDLIDRGKTAAYHTDAYGNLDLAGNPRVAGPEAAGATIDIGAFEYQPVPSSRIRYVKPGGTGDGTSWANASGDLQRMIDQLAEQNPQGLPGEVWVAVGTYEPQAYLINGEQYSSSFRMRDGISVYGGFEGTGETSKASRTRGTMPWDFAHRTVLKGSYYQDDNVSYANNRWSVTGDSRHVVWFAPMPGEADGGFTRPTYLDGVTVKGGYAQGGTGLDNFMTDRGAGVYMDGANCYLTNSIVTQNNATGPGGGVYLRDGRIQGCLLYNNNAGQDGGAVYVEGTGLVHRSMLSNNSAANGAGVYLSHTGGEHPEYLILSTCVVSNNTARENGAVYCAGGGVLLQNTVANNWCPTTTDATDPDASQTGGLYIDGYGLVFSTVLWNNRLGGGTQATAGTNIPVYVRNPSVEQVRFSHCAISGVNNAVWNDVLQEQMLSLVDANAGAPDNDGSIGPRFSHGAGQMADDTALNTTIGVQDGWTDGTANTVGISYYWEPVTGSNLWARGMELGQLPEEVVLAPELDLEGTLFNQRPAIGAHHVDGTPVVPELDGQTLRLYVDAASTLPENDGRSWAQPYRSLNDAIRFFAGLTDGEQITVVENGAENTSFEYSAADVTGFEILVLEGNLYPRYAYVNDDPKTATLDILPMPGEQRLRIAGGYAYRNTDQQDAYRDPLAHRSQLNGNNSGQTLADGIYHVVTVEAGANVELDGFHIINGYAAGTAALQYGAGVLVHDGATVTLTGCILENNTALSGAAVYADAAASLTLNNCVVNNNTNTDTTHPVIVGPTEGDLALNHVTIVNNEGAAVEDERLLSASSFSKGNDSKNSIDEPLATTDEAGARNFANPTNGKGATLGFDTYLGGYSSFRPLTSSADAAAYIINRVANATALGSDIMGNERDLGGVPDLGAYEADLPKAGKVIYVRSYNTVWDGSDAGGDREESDGDPSMALSTAGDGSSWENAINGNAICYVRVIENPEASIQGTEAGFYVNGDNNQLRQSSLDYTPYATEGDSYGPEAGCYSGFWEAEDNEQNQGGDRNRYNKIANDRDEQYISGLQYAVEKAAYLNSQLAEGEEPVEVWVGAGIYTDYKGFVIRDKVNVLGGFPNEGVPGENDRHPLISDYIPANDADAGLTKSDYETILQVRKESPFKQWNGYTPTIADWFTRLPGTQRHYVLYQPDECLPTWNIQGNNDRGSRTGANQYRYDYPGNSYVDNNYYNEYEGASWDGFTVRHGYIKGYTANRDGGAGVRVFRGVTLQNMVIVNNCNHNANSRNRGGGLYMDSDNGRINNSFIMQNCINYNNKNDNLGGGAYIIVGTGYNLVVANNYSADRGGGIFIESATFYNNTIAYNYASGGGSGLFQYQDPDDHTRASSLTLYNCLFYGNRGSNVITTTTVETFNEAYNCYVEGKMNNDLSNKFTSVNGNQTGSLPNPFAAMNNAQALNNYRLVAPEGENEYSCINRGIESVEQADGTIRAFDLPETDMDFTDRIKDCTVDIGAYELDNTANTKPYQSSATLATYFVTYNGRGNASANSPENAACWEKLQTVLNAAGQYALEHPEVNVQVKIAGYEEAEDFPYHVTARAEENDPQSYSFVIPYGVTVLGGYNEGDSEGNDANWNTQDATTYKTILSAVKLGTSSTTQDINGYHTVTFGAKPDGWNGAAKPTVIDGVWLTDGSATSLAGTGNANTRGGGAIVPQGAHVRNCVVTGNSAIQGGGLYVLPGGRVSGTLVTGNSATTGGGIYVDNGGKAEGDADNRAHLFSNTIAENSATTGGGLYLEDGAAMTVNSVIWGNLGDDGKNVSGVVNELFEDALLGSLSSSIGKWYPFNNCFVETRELPGNFENSEMTGERDVYFADLYMLKPYSPLVNHGMVESVQEALEVADKFGLAAYDMAGTQRKEDNFKMDAGAFARDGAMPTDLVTRLFVSQGSNVVLADGANENYYIGRSFYTSFTWLEDALDYIKEMRSDRSAHKEDARAAEFEILVAGGTYKPRYRRGNTGGQEKNSFVIPYGVRIYGGFTGKEMISSGKVTNIPLSDGTSISVTNTEDAFADTLNARAYSDFNQNGIEEAWELAEQTIFSGVLNGTTADGKNANHVLYSVADGASTDGAAKGVVLDGVTVMGGATETSLSAVTDDAADLAEGRGGGIYSNGIPYTLVRSRLLDNRAVRGGGIFVKDADLTIVNSILAGNRTVANTSDETKRTLTSRGGAAYVAGNTQATTLYAVNTLWANNESAGEGGAIGTNYNTGTAGISAADPLIDLMNCTFVRNAAVTNPVIFSNNAKSRVVNTLIWGNEGKSYDDETSIADMFEVSHSASDEDYDGKFAEGNTDNNILLSEVNMAVDGPRFTRPATVAGAAGNSADNLWNPASTSLVTDAGDGKIPYENVQNPPGPEEGAHIVWKRDYASDYVSDYMGSADYARYSGPRGENNEELDKKIDIGVYEYQYSLTFSKMPAIYVATVRAGDGSGLNWDNATDDLRGAIIGAANPEGSETTTGEKKHRTVYVRDGEYMWPQLSTGTAYPLNTSNNFEWESVTIKGSCNGVGLGDAAQQDFSKPSVIRNHPDANGTTRQLMNISANDKQVTVEGFAFINEAGSGINASTGTDGSLTLKNTAFRLNKEKGVNISANSGSVLIVNTLFADNEGTGLASAGKTTLVNTTFANNGVDMTGSPEVYNSVSWNNGVQNMPEGNNNAIIADDIENRDLHKGPNFVDPENTDVASRDYRIRPSLTLLNKGSNDLYATEAMGKAYDETQTDFFSGERDLYNVSRVVDGTIDIGAYEYASPLQQIIYVKSNLSNSDDSGSSWENATGDLQGAADLAGIYANNNLEKAYVLVHNNVTESDGLRVTLPGVKVYGGMNDERYQGTSESAEDIVDNLLNQRVGLLERSEKSQLNGVTVSAASVVDGFEVTGDVTLSGSGCLSTSVVDGAVSAPTTGSTSVGILYNTLVFGSVSGVQAVNVTATGDITGADGSGNNRAATTELNHYVKGEKYWEYQLNDEDNVNMDVDEDAEERGEKTQEFFAMVGHERDIAGNLRIRNEKVDNGCFETWNVTADAKVTADDYPHGKSVVYVRTGQELILGKTGKEADEPVYGTAAPFNPGFLLLEHQAGLRGNGNSVGLTNFAVERTLNDSGTDLAAMPFTVESTALPYDITKSTDVTVQTYDGAKRSGYNYLFSSTEGEAWKDVTDITSLSPGTGFALEAKPGTTDNIKVRFYGTSYTENSTAKEVTLKQWNFQAPWSPDKNSNRFTHKENMGWNLFGSPYLCAMNYTDMEYGRVLYGLVSAAAEDNLTPGGYFPVLTYKESDGASIEGHIPAGDAVFTQTATLEDAEKFTVEQPKEVPNGDGSTTITKSGSAYETSSTLSLSLSAADGAKRSVSGRAECDRLQLNAVPTEQSLADFDLGIDGVKWMSAEGEPQIFAVRGAGRYSLLGALDEESTTTVGVTTAEGGRYAIGIADDCPAEGYETVLLHDRTTGATADLLQGAYSFAVAAGEDCSERFEVSFRAAADGLVPGAATMRASVDDGGLLRVWNLPELTTRVVLYDVEGRAIGGVDCEGRSEVSFRLTGHGVYVVQNDRGERLKVVW